MLEGQRWVFIPITLFISGVLLIMMLRSPLRRYQLFNITCVLVLAGAIGNLIDRIAYGYVIDFLYFRLIDSPIFNFADCCVVIGAVLLFVFVLFVMKEDDEMPLRTLFFGIEKKSKEKSSLQETVGGVYWCAVTAGYLLWSFLSFDWHITWVVWPVAAVLFGAIEALLLYFENRKQ
jgi:signal peptidase II